MAQKTVVTVVCDLRHDGEERVDVAKLANHLCSKYYS